jgi:hypothetical protein
VSTDPQPRWQQPPRLRLVQRVAFVGLAAAALGDIVAGWDDVAQKALLYVCFAIVAVTGILTIVLRQRAARERRSGGP